MKVKEIDIQKAIKDYLQYMENQGKLMFIRNQAGGYPTKEGHYITMGKKGSPDLFVWMSDLKFIDGYFSSQLMSYLRCIVFEIKSKKGKQTKSQKVWQEKFEKLGGEYYIVRSIEEVIEIL